MTLKYDKDCIYGKVPSVAIRTGAAEFGWKKVTS